MTESPLVSVQDLSKTFSARLLFKNLSLGLFEGERTGLIGPNGAGKSTLLRILAGREDADRGSRAVRKNTRLAFVEQTPTFGEAKTVLEALQVNLDLKAIPEDQREAKTARALNQLGLEPEQELTTLSGGQRKRTALIAHLLAEPDLLFLDEPTNHLDFEGIHWLEKQLKAFKGAFLLISHDRAFLEVVCNRVLELNRRYSDGFFSCEGNYSFFLEKRSEHLEAQQQYQQVLANKVRREVAWLRQGVKARTTKSKSRIQAAEKMQEELSQVKERNRKNTAGVEFSGTGRKSQKLIDASNLSLSFADKAIFQGVDISLQRKTRLGLVGSNGSGKSSLMKILGKQINPTDGSVLWADDLRVRYFEQDRSSLKPELSVAKNLCEDSDHVNYLGRSLHVASYARRFLFESEHLNLPIERLSGGEQARLLIAKLMLEPADVLLLDEPTNDLDIETMDIFSESLMEFTGALVLVTHDRFFLDQLCEEVLALEDEAPSQKYSSLAQWEAERAARAPKIKTEKSQPSKPRKLKPKKLSYNEKREWEQMEEKILVAEEALERWKSAVEDPNVTSSPEKLKEVFENMSEAQKLVDQLYARWAELEEKQSPS